MSPQTTAYSWKMKLHSHVFFLNASHFSLRKRGCFFLMLYLKSNRWHGGLLTSAGHHPCDGCHSKWVANCDLPHYYSWYRSICNPLEITSMRQNVSYIRNSDFQIAIWKLLFLFYVHTAQIICHVTPFVMCGHSYQGYSCFAITGNPIDNWISLFLFSFWS